MIKDSPVIDVIIPAFNEENAVGRVISDIPRKLVRSVIVCNNGSVDRTREVASAMGAIVLDEPRQGYGYACLRGIDHIRTSEGPKPDVVVFIDADYSDYPQEMLMLVAPILAGEADLVIGSRVKGKMEKGSMTPPQIFGNWLATNLIRIIYAYRFTDLGPFRAIRWQSLIDLEMKDQTYGWTVEMQVKAAKMQLRCKEVAVSYRKRIGKSKISGTVKGTVMAGQKILWTIFKLI